MPKDDASKETENATKEVGTKNTQRGGKRETRVEKNCLSQELEREGVYELYRELRVKQIVAVARETSIY